MKGVPFLSRMVHKRLRGSLDLRAPGRYSGFQVTGMIEGFFGFEIFDFGILFGWLDLSTNLFGYSKLINLFHFSCYIIQCFLEIFTTWKLGMGNNVLGLNFGLGTFWGLG